MPRASSSSFPRGAGGGRRKGEAGDKISEKRKKQEKEERLNKKLHLLEVGQVEEFLRQRSLEVDREMEETRERMKLSLSLSKKSRPPPESSDLLEGIDKSTLQVKGRKSKEGLGLERDKLHEDAVGRRRKESSHEWNYPHGSNKEETYSSRDMEIRNLKQRMVQSFEEASMSPSQVTETFLPTELAKENEVILLLEEVVEILQIDFVMPISENDQNLLKHFFGAKSDGLINVKNLLSDLGYWDRSHSSHAHDKRKTETYGGDGGDDDDDLDAELPSRFKSNTYSGQSSKDKSVQWHQKFSTMGSRESGLPTDKKEYRDNTDSAEEHDYEFYNTHANRSALEDIHALVNSNTKPLDADINSNQNEEKGTDEDDEDEKLLKMLRSHAAKEKERMETFSTKDSTDVDEALSKKQEADKPAEFEIKQGHKTSNIQRGGESSHEKSLREIAAENVATQLAIENERLKKELGAFDSEFFEELEDLKYKYSKLQDTLGDGPVIRAEKQYNAHASSRLTPSYDYSSASGHKEHESTSRSVDQLPWASERKPNKQLDRVKATSSLMQRPFESEDDHPHPMRHEDPLTSLYTMRGSNNERFSDYVNDGYKASKTIDGHALKRSIKEQVHESKSDDNYESLCERRLLFELRKLSNPSKAASTLIHWVNELSFSNSDNVGYISCDQLRHVLVDKLGLHLSAKEVALIAMGFASDGSDKINAEEFNMAIQSLFHSTIGEDRYAETKEEAVARLALSTIRTLAQDLLTHKKFVHLLYRRKKIVELVDAVDESALATEIDNLQSQVIDDVSRPFKLMDDNRNGIITSKGFIKIIHYFCPGISDEEVEILVTAFQKPAAPDQEKLENDMITEFRNRQLMGSLKGTARENAELSDWLRHSLPGQIKVDMGATSGKVLVEYPDFIKNLVDAMLDVILDLNRGVDFDDLEVDSKNKISTNYPSLPCLVTEYGELLDALLAYLEGLSSVRQRQCLIRLQNNFTKQYDADGHAEGNGYLDGFSVLKALVSSGFPISRSLRAKFLHSVESMSGKFNFLELCKFLMSSCCSWPESERKVMGKILQSMGATAAQRRAWLVQLKKDLCLASWSYRTQRSGDTQSWTKSRRSVTNQDWHDVIEEKELHDEGVPASTFLHCLREVGVSLSVDEEATLLDCLDFESQAMELMQGEGASNDPLHLNSGDATFAHLGSDLSVSLIKYRNFLTVCARHAGKWYQACPDIDEHLKALMIEKQETEVIAGLKEFQMLLKAFDEDSKGRIGYRPFLISCRRSTLLCGLDEDVVTELAKVLVEEGSGTVPYGLFLLHLKGIFHQIKSLHSASRKILSKEDSEKFQIFNQLLNNAVEKQDGSLYPLRRWIRRVCDENRKSFISNTNQFAALHHGFLTTKDLSHMLQEFGVSHSPEELDMFIEDIKTPSALFDYFSASGGHPLHHCPEEATDMRDDWVEPSHVLHCLLQSRESWTARSPALASKIKKMLSRASTRSVEILLSRLKTFARFTNSKIAEGDLEIDFADDEDGDSIDHLLEDKEPKRVSESSGVKRSSSKLMTSLESFISKEAFCRVVRSCGLDISDKEAAFLADDCDANVDPNMIRVGVILEALKSSNGEDSLQHTLHTVQKDMQDNKTFRNGKLRKPSKMGTGGKHVVESAAGTHRHDSPTTHAIKHLQALLMNSSHMMHRTTAEWANDVMSLMDGFDRGGGVCTPQDFVMGLKILSVRISVDILSHIPRISKSVDMIPYRDILELLFANVASPDGHRTHGYEDHYSLGRDLLKMENEASEDINEYQTKHSMHTDNGRSIKGSQYGTESGCPPAVNQLVHTVRKRLNIFLAGKADDEQALSTLLSTFGKFDYDQNEFVSPRDFCLAVSVLMDGDVPLLTKSDWESVIKYFQLPEVIKKHRRQRTPLKPRYGQHEEEMDTHSVPSGQVHYASFVHLALDRSFSSAGSAAATHPSRRYDNRTINRSPRRSSTPVQRRSLSSSLPVRGGSVDSRASHFNASKKKPKSYINRNRNAMSSRPAMFRADYDEDEEEYASTTTLTGRGVVGANKRNHHRSQLQRLSAPRVGLDSMEDHEYSIDHLDGESDELNGHLTSQHNKSTATLQREAHDLQELNRYLNRQAKKKINYIPALKELHDELHSVLAVKSQLTGGKSSMTSILRTHLQMEDKNNSGTLSKHSTLAAMNGLGLVYHFWSKSTQKQLINALMSLHHGEVDIEDFIKISYLPN